MIDRNFSFDFTNLQYVQELAHDPDVSTSDPKEGSIFFKEKLLLGRLLGEGGGQIRNHISSWNTFIEHYSEAARVTRLVGENLVEQYRMISQVLGCDVIVGKDKFFNVPSWWSFQLVERGSLLLASLKLLQETGTASYFLHLTDSKNWKEIRAGLEDYLLRSCKCSSNTMCNAKGGGSENAAVTFHDSLITEAFTLLLHGQTAAILVLVFETYVELTIYTR